MHLARNTGPNLSLGRGNGKITGEFLRKPFFLHAQYDTFI